MGPLYGDGDEARELETDRVGGRYRSEFRRDYARLIHSPAFRRLQGKTQLFPSAESDFFRNRLTHSLEVAQIAKSITLRINDEYEYFRTHPINLDLIETAGLAHDLGHPPFGHIGEAALDERMREHGGFEGNAQTLRILARLEKKELVGADGAQSPRIDNRVGLNLTYRTLAAVLKYDTCIPARRERTAALVKGYYASEAALVTRIKHQVLQPGPVNDQQPSRFKTIECQIMDLADDIAYSTYDLEDAFKTGFVSPMLMITALTSRTVVDAVERETGLSKDRIFALVTDLWRANVDDGNGRTTPSSGPLETATYVQKVFSNLVEDGAHRTALTSEMVNECVEGIAVDLNEGAPPLSQVTLDPELRERVEVIKCLPMN